MYNLLSASHLKLHLHYKHFCNYQIANIQHFRKVSTFHSNQNPLFQQLQKDFPLFALELQQSS